MVQTIHYPQLVDLTRLNAVPVTGERIKLATEHGIHNAEKAAQACGKTGLPFYAACALLEKESHGENVYGHDAGGALSGYSGPVNEGSYQVFTWMVFTLKQTSNGVGPCQLTYPGYFTAMEAKGLKPWVVLDNMTYGFAILLGHYDSLGKSWQAAGTAYNGSAAYGKDLAAKVQSWKSLLGVS